MKFTPRSEDTRQFIIETTAEIFNTKGYAGTSMTDLTEATQLTKGSIYGNFENKEEVALAVLDYMIAIRTRAIREQLDKAATNKDKLLVYPTVYSSSRSQVFPKGGCPLLNMGTEADDTHEGLRKKVAEAFTQWKKQIESIIADGIAAKEFSPDTHAEETALRIIATIEGSTLLSRIMRKPGYHDVLLNSVKELIEKISLT